MAVVPESPFLCGRAFLGATVLAACPPPGRAVMAGIRPCWANHRPLHRRVRPQLKRSRQIPGAAGVAGFIVPTWRRLGRLRDPVAAHRGGWLDPRKVIGSVDTADFASAALASLPDFHRIAASGIHWVALALAWPRSLVASAIWPLTPGSTRTRVTCWLWRSAVDLLTIPRTPLHRTNFSDVPGSTYSLSAVTVLDSTSPHCAPTQGGGRSAKSAEWSRRPPADDNMSG